ncbi:MAG: lytic transglycosylase [Proteobacteria bacterium]|nr:MAG: lytic transglycosylase [Pseudomonadota bacterium]
MSISARQAALRSTLAAAFLVFTAGCSHLATTDESEPEDDLARLKLDEADIGTLGPEQIEQAIEALDAQTRDAPKLVGEPGETTADAQPEHSDLFERIRAGFQLSDVDHPQVERQVRWYARNPEYLDRTFKRGERYLYHIVNELEARQMPLELALLPVVESAFNPVAYSRARAAGLWQFIPGTGLRYGLKQNWYYDGRRDVIEATRAALDYLQFLANEFDGDWLLAIAAYNTGEMNVARAIARNRAAGKPTDFFSLKLHRETTAYVPKLLAMRRIVADPAAHDLEFAPIPNEPYFSVVDTAGQLDLQLAAELAGVSKEELLALNPAFNHWVTDPDGPHRLLVPVAREEAFVQALAELPPEKRVRVVYHRVRSGDTLSAIAQRYGVSVAALRTANNLRGSLIHPGQDLLVTPAPGVTAATTQRVASATPVRSASGRHVVRRGDTLWGIARRHGVSLDSLASHNGLSRQDTLSIGQVLNIPGAAATTLASTNPAGEAVTYVVRSGDTLSSIANRFRVRLADLLGWNDLDSSNIIRPGQRLVMYVENRNRS